MDQGKQEKVLQYVQATVQAALPHESYDPIDPMILDVSDRDMYVASSRRNTAQTSRFSK